MGKKQVLDERLGMGYVTGKGDRDTLIARTKATKSQYGVSLPKRKLSPKRPNMKVKSNSSREEGGGRSHHV